MDEGRLTVGIVSRTFYYVPLWAALRERLFEAEGLQVHTCLLGNDDPVQALREGRCQIAIAPPDSVLQDVDRGGATVLVGGNADRLSHRLVVQPGIDSVAALRGRRIGVLSRTEGSFFHFKLLARAHGLRFPEEFEVVETGGAPLRHRLLLERRIDAGLQSLPWVYLAQEAGLTVLGDISDVVPVWQFNTLNADRGWVDAHGAELAAFLAVMRRSADHFYRDGDRMALVASESMEVPWVHARRAWQDLTEGQCLTRDLSINVEGLRLVHASLVDAGLVIAQRTFEPSRYLMPGTGLAGAGAP
ncbi:ABC transporter substrate-binding protein [Aquabacterium sp. J223]|uniref:ABC transporter substrate-binding protein n=1 Tax=Aquabacterium sp. J223 TaxID=2898431 RepID=UPI0021ADFDFA|nr:ABC transporter substrate-binding protein [Aquabacterium sp. J223]UUX95324.1 ABC transporter substrate-binding protein [Aquabacterium sp. J223]